jgi:hypothetical protein
MRIIIVWCSLWYYVLFIMYNLFLSCVIIIFDVWFIICDELIVMCSKMFLICDGLFVIYDRLQVDVFFIMCDEMFCVMYCWCDV